MKLLIEFPCPMQGVGKKLTPSGLQGSLTRLMPINASPCLTWAAVGSQVAVTVPVAGRAAVDGAVIVIVAGIRPCVCQPRLSGRFTDVEKSWPMGRKVGKSKFYINSKSYFLFRIPTNLSPHYSYK